MKIPSPFKSITNLPKTISKNCSVAKSLVKTQFTSGGSRQSMKVFGSKRMRSL